MDANAWLEVLSRAEDEDEYRRELSMDPTLTAPVTLPLMEVAERLGVSEPTVRAWLRVGILKGELMTSRRNGRPGWRIDKDDFERFLGEHPHRYDRRHAAA